MEYDLFLDTSGLECPLPLLKLKQCVNQLNNGQVVYVVATDPNSVADFLVFAKQTGNEVIKRWSEENKLHFLVKKA